MLLTRWLDRKYAEEHLQGTQLPIIAESIISNPSNLIMSELPRKKTQLSNKDIYETSSWLLINQTLVYF